MSRSALSLLAEFDRLFERVVMEPAAWDDQAFAEWLDAAFEEPPDREAAKIVQRAVRRARRLQRYWAARSAGPADWRLRVDETLGSAGWRPGLDILEWGLARDPDPEVFAVYAERFKSVKFVPLDMTFEEWLAGR